VIQALQTSLLHLLKQEWSKIPALRMIMEPLQSVRDRAGLLASHIPHSTVRSSEGAIGGGSTPDQSLPTFVVEVKTENASKLERALRLGEPPVLVRIEKGNVLLDCRTIQDSEVVTVGAIVSGRISE
jgi:L-seryl-tRNA(Ser) seleniumtransferase